MAGMKYAGANSSLTLSGLTAGVHEYSVTPTIDKLETTTFDDAADGVLWETSMAGMYRGGTIPVRVRYDSTNTIAMGDTGTLTLTLESGKTISCSVWVQSTPYVANISGLVESDITLQVTGPITFPA
jgi:hypothetical protein